METILFIILIVFCCSLINSTFGFGFAMVSMPILSLYFSLEIIGPLIPLLFIAGSTIIVVRGRKEIQYKSIISLVISASLFVPIGVYLSKYADESLIKIILGSFIIIFSIYNLITPKIPYIKNDRYAAIFGALSGLFGGAYNISGPPVVIYGSLRQWSPPTFRVTLQFYFWLLTILIICSHVYMNSYQNSKIGYYFLYAFPAMIIAVPIGKKINSFITNPSAFNKYVYILMLISG